MKVLREGRHSQVVRDILAHVRKEFRSSTITGIVCQTKPSVRRAGVFNDSFVVEFQFADDLKFGGDLSVVVRRVGDETPLGFISRESGIVSLVTPVGESTAGSLEDALGEFAGRTLLGSTILIPLLSPDTARWWDPSKYECEVVINGHMTTITTQVPDRPLGSGYVINIESGEIKKIDEIAEDRIRVTHLLFYSRSKSED